MLMIASLLMCTTPVLKNRLHIFAGNLLFLIHIERQQKNNVILSLIQYNDCQKYRCNTLVQSVQ